MLTKSINWTVNFTKNLVRIFSKSTKMFITHITLLSLKGRIDSSKGKRCMNQILMMDTEQD